MDAALQLAESLFRSAAAEAPREVLAARNRRRAQDHRLLKHLTLWRRNLPLVGPARAGALSRAARQRAASSLAHAALLGWALETMRAARARAQAHAAALATELRAADWSEASAQRALGTARAEVGAAQLVSRLAAAAALAEISAASSDRHVPQADDAQGGAPGGPGQSVMARDVRRTLFGRWRAGAALGLRAAVAAGEAALVAAGARTDELVLALSEANEWTASAEAARTRLAAERAQAAAEARAANARVAALERSQEEWAEAVGRRRTSAHSVLRAAVAAWRAHVAVGRLRAAQREVARAEQHSASLAASLVRAHGETRRAHARTRAAARRHVREAARFALARRRWARDAAAAHGVLSTSAVDCAMANARELLATERAGRAEAKLARCEARELARAESLWRERAISRAFRTVGAKVRAASAERLASALQTTLASAASRAAVDAARADTAERRAAAVERAMALASRARRQQRDKLRTRATLATWRAKVATVVAARARAEAARRSARAVIWNPASWEEDAIAHVAASVLEAERDERAEFDGNSPVGKSTPPTAAQPPRGALSSRAGNWSAQRRSSCAGSTSAENEDVERPERSAHASLRALREEHRALSAHQHFVSARLAERTSPSAASAGLPRRG